MHRILTPAQSPATAVTAGSDIIKAELEEKQFKVALTVIDTPGFGDYVNNRESWAPIVDFIVRVTAPSLEWPMMNSAFSYRMTNTSHTCVKSNNLSVLSVLTSACTLVCTSSVRPVTREFRYDLALNDREATETICHCSLKPLDIEIMKRLGTRVNLIPIVAKADTLTPQALASFKHSVCTLAKIHDTGRCLTNNRQFVLDSRSDRSSRDQDVLATSRGR